LGEKVGHELKRNKRKRKEERVKYNHAPNDISSL